MTAIRQTTSHIATFLKQPVSIAPLVVFRIAFGLLMLISIFRFTAKGWIQTQYLDPEFFFSYYGFEWVVSPGAPGIYLLFALMAAGALGIMLGAWYRVSAALFFLSFTYVELIDKTNYLNHYYFVSLVAFLLIFLPAHRSFSFDARRLGSWQSVPRWCILIIQVQLALVYFYAGAAKLNSDWLLEATPLRLWLPVHHHLPLVGPLLDEVWVAYAFSWAGAIYDLTIPFFLFHPRTRGLAYVAVVGFHGLTALLFPIGMFPWIMMVATLIFFSEKLHEKILHTLRRWFPGNMAAQQLAAPMGVRPAFIYLLGVVLLFQLVFPWRYLAYPDNLFWSEEGYRFSWRVMLMEKAGYVIFHVTDPDTGRQWEAYGYEHLTPVQEKMMATQPDMILQYAHFLEEHYRKQGIADPEIRAEAYVTLNGKGSRLFLDPDVDLTREEDGWAHKSWILPFSKPIAHVR